MLEFRFWRWKCASQVECVNVNTSLRSEASFRLFGEGLGLQPPPKRRGDISVDNAAVDFEFEVVGVSFGVSIPSLKFGRIGA